jgi:hypothetical protein
VLAALLAADDRIFLDALHLICGGTKLTEPVTEQEMNLLVGALPLRIKGNAPHARKQILSALRRWLHRLKRSTFASARDLRDVDRANRKQGGDEDAALKRATDKLAYARRVADWLNWFAGLLLEHLYPGSPAVRSLLALDLYELFIEMWTQPTHDVASQAASAPADPADNASASLACSEGSFAPAILFGPGFASHLVQLLLQNYEVRRAANRARLLPRTPEHMAGR